MVWLKILDVLFLYELHIYIYIYIYILYMYMYMHVYVYACIYIYIYTHTYIHTYIHTYTHTFIYIYILFIFVLFIFTEKDLFKAGLLLRKADTYEKYVLDRKVLFPNMPTARHGGVQDDHVPFMDRGELHCVLCVGRETRLRGEGVRSRCEALSDRSFMVDPLSCFLE